MAVIVLFFAFLISARADIFGPPTVFRGMAGAPPSVQCQTQGDTKRAMIVDYTAVPTAYYVCKQTSSGVFAWTDIGAGGGGGGGGAATSLNNLSGVSINASLIPQSGKSLGAQDTPWQTICWYGSGTYGSHSWCTAGTPTGNRTITFPDASITVAGSASALTSGRVPYGTTGGLLTGSAGLTFSDSANVRLLTVRAGSSQSTSNLQEWQDNSGVAQAYLVFDSANTQATLGVDTVVSPVSIWRLGQAQTGLGFPSTWSISWSSLSGYSGADTALTRASANNIGITNASSTTYAIIGAGGLQFGTDNTYDIGASGATRPRNVYVAAGVIAAAGTFSAAVSLSNLGATFTASDTNPTCSAGVYAIYADLSETQLKKCVNGTVSDLATSGPSLTVSKASIGVDFPSAVDGQCVTQTGLTVTGAATSDAIIVGATPAVSAAGYQFSAWATASNTITAQFCNLSGGTVDLASATFQFIAMR